jgi:protein-disulfide isomerase
MVQKMSGQNQGKSRKEKIEEAREERVTRSKVNADSINFNKKVWTIVGGASTFALVASLSLGVGIGLGTGNLTGDGQNMATGSVTNIDDGNTSALVPVDPDAATGGIATLTKGAQSDPANAATDGFLFTSVGKIVPSDSGVTGQASINSDDKIDLKIYLDYSCSFCKIFEDVESQNLKNALAAGDTTISYNIMGFLSSYSNAAGNASACVASLEPNRWDEVHLALFAGQENGASYTNDGAAGGYVKNLLTPFELGSDTMSCISEMRHLDWLQRVTSKFFSTGQDDAGKAIEGTPTVVADGKLYMGDDFRAVGNMSGLIEQQRALLK